MLLLGSFAKFITAREDVRIRRAAGCKPPWTDDPILAAYRFCNINREHDRVTIGIREIYECMPDESLWFHLVVARLFNNLETLRNFGWMSCPSWASTIDGVCRKMDKHGQKIFNSAYIVSTNGKAMPKPAYLITYVLRPIARDWKQSWEGALSTFTGCDQWAEYLLGFNGLGDFMVNQIVTDLKYTSILPKKTTPDWKTFVMAGPGTKRGLNRLFGRPTKQALSRDKAYDELLAVRLALALHKHPLRGYFDDLNNLANSFCEFDKYQRVITGEGKPKQRYQPAV